MDEISTLEEAYSMTVGVHDLPFRKCDWATVKVLAVLSLSFQERAGGDRIECWLRCLDQDKICDRKSSTVGRLSRQAGCTIYSASEHYGLGQRRCEHT